MEPSSKHYNLLAKWKFVQVVTSDPKLARCAVATAFHLTDYYNNRLGRAWPSYDTLAELTGSNRRTVIEAVKRLIELEYFVVDKGSGRRSNYYRPNFSLINNNSQQPADSEADTPAVGTSAPSTKNIEVNSPSPNTSYVPVAPSGGDVEVSPRFVGSSALGAPSPSRGAPPGFEEFWQAYPKKERIKEARIAYSEALELEGITPELLARKADQYAEAKAGVVPKFIRYPQSWLNDECWLEDPQPSIASKSSKPKTKSKRSAKKTPAANQSKTKAPKSPQKKKPQLRRARQAKRKPPTWFGDFAIVYCDHLGITLEDLSLAMGVKKNYFSKVCDGNLSIPTPMKDKAKSLLIQAVAFRPEDEPVDVDWLANWYEQCVRGAPQNKYKWRSPIYYEDNPTDVFSSG